MQGRKPGNLIIMIVLLALLSVLITVKLNHYGIRNEKKRETIDDPQFRKNFYSKQMRKNRNDLSKGCGHLLNEVEKEVKYFPIMKSTVDQSLAISFIDSWMVERTYNGTSGHEGTDIMAEQNKRGLYPVVSMTDGMITNLGWLEKGGYRIGITSESGTYYYYAHLDSYGNIKEGDKVKAGTFLGYMGDSGYGKEGTVGKFAVHLHLGIYSYATGDEVSVNPYHVLRYLQENRKGSVLESVYSQHAQNMVY